MLTNLDFLNPGRPWPPRSERARLKKYMDNKMLFEGDHALVFKDAWERLSRPEWNYDSYEIMFNWFKRLSTLWADLLLGEAPSVSDKASEGNTEYLDELIEKLNLWGQGYTGVIDASRFGECVLKVWKRKTGEVVLSVVPPMFWFPVVSPEDANDIKYHVLAFPSVPDEEEDPHNQNGRLYVEIHSRDEIEFRVYKMPMMQGTLEEPIEEPRKEPVKTGLCHVVYIPALKTSDTVYSTDDYSDLTSIILEIEVRFAQLARVFDKHADPKMYGPPLQKQKDPETGQEVVPNGDYFPIPDKETTTPGYLVWDAKAEQVFQEIDKLMQQFYALSETTAAVFGEIKAGLAESGSALRRLLMAPLAKVNRVRMNFDPGLKQVIKIAAMLDGGKKVSPLISWKDGLPDDEAEQTNIESTAVAAGITSKKSAMKRTYGFSDEEADVEMRQIKDEGAIEEPTNIEFSSQAEGDNTKGDNAAQEDGGNE